MYFNNVGITECNIQYWGLIWAMSTSREGIAVAYCGLNTRVIGTASILDNRHLQFKLKRTYIQVIITAQTTRLVKLQKAYKITQLRAN